MEQAGLAVLPTQRGDWSAASGFAVGTRGDLEEHTAVFAANDEMALGFMSARRDLGFVAPDDYSIVGVDDMPEAQYFAPPLTTIHMDFVGLGRAGLEMVLERIRTGDDAARRVITPHLVPRASTTSIDATTPCPR